MENKKQKCSLKEHNELDAISYCPECKMYMCNKCEKLHLGLFQNHHSFTLDKDLKEIFTGFCKVENHQLELVYYCKTHNELCCAQCITKIKSRGNGQHIDCDICDIVDILEFKKKKFKK